MFEGVITALPTPFRSGVVDEDALRRLVDDQIVGGVNGLVPCGTTGESPTLTTDEHIRVIEIVVQAARKRVPVIAGTGSPSTRETIEVSQAARRVGADGLLLVTPYYNKPTQEGLIRHFDAIVTEVPLPSIVYNVPGRTGCDLLPDTVARLADIKTIVGVKEATGSTTRASQVLARVRGRLKVLSGDDASNFAIYALGGHGTISVVSNVAPREQAAMWRAAVAGEWAKARDLHFSMQTLAEVLFLESNPIPVKAALAMMGRMSDDLRPPLYPMSGPAREKVRAALTELHLL